jgi:FSR family fosmidomycin resistance protein-like MFS transporter
MNTTDHHPAASIRTDATVIGLIGMAHSMSHFSQLLLAPLFPWLKASFGVGYAELGALLTVFFAMSCTVQALAGFAVDRSGPLPVLFAGLGLITLSVVGLAFSQQYWHLMVCAALVGAGNGVFHPVDFTLLNRLVSSRRLGHAYSVHGISGTVGWGFAPALMVPVALHGSWRSALLVAAAVAGAVMAVLWLQRRRLALPVLGERAPRAVGNVARAPEHPMAFLRVPAVWACFVFFFFYAGAMGGMQSFAPEAARSLHGIAASVAAACLTIYMVGSALGMVVGGFLAQDPTRCERVIATCVGVAVLGALAMAWAPVPALLVPVLFALMGFLIGTAGPSRDLIVKRATPDNATGRVYGIVYSGLDTGMALAPLAFGFLMDHHQPMLVWLLIALLQAVLILTATRVRHARRSLHAVPV